MKDIEDMSKEEILKELFTLPPNTKTPNGHYWVSTHQKYCRQTIMCEICGKHYIKKSIAIKHIKRCRIKEKKKQFMKRFTIDLIDDLKYKKQEGIED